MIIAQPRNMDYLLVETEEVRQQGIDDGLLALENSGKPFMNYIGTDSIDTACRKVEEDGGRIALPKAEIGPGMGWVGPLELPKETSLDFHEVLKKSAE
jgi:predicted enzyme related to lactoylglutathione lyase